MTDKQLTELRSVLAKREELLAKREELFAEGNKLYAKSDKLRVEGDKLLTDCLKNTKHKFSSIGGFELLIVDDKIIPTGSSIPL